MNKEREIVPKLRFPEFKNSGFLACDFLGNLSIVLRGGSPRPIDEFLTTDNDSLNWLKIGDVNKEDKYITQTSEKIKKQGLEKTRVVSPGDLIMSNSMSFGRPYILKIKTCIHDGWIAITEINNKVNKEYLYYYILSDISQNYFLQSAAGSGVKNLNAEIIKKLLVNYSVNHAEQQKIADCLSSIDELIDAESRKLEKLKKYKKGLIQKLFPAEGETLPEWRFPEFQGGSKWKYKEIGRLGEVITGKTPSTADLSLWDGDIQFVTPTDITENKYQYHTQRTVVRTSKMTVLPKHTIMFTCIASIGKIALSVHPCITNQQINSVIPKPCYNNEFIYYSLLQKTFLIKAGFANSTLPIINKTDFSKIQIPIIGNGDEQQKIADCLSGIDSLITSQIDKIEMLKTHKKGLMQGLFPSLEEADV